jgi:DNA excision repair protein ERCC-4
MIVLFVFLAARKRINNETSVTEMADETTSIVVDDRERSSDVLSYLTRMNSIHLFVRRLRLGDYLVDGRLLFERKTLSDFARSVIDGRFFRQMALLAASPLKSVLILEGNSRQLIKMGMRREALQGALINANLILGLPVLRSINGEETAKLMLYCARQVKTVASGGIARAGYRPIGKRKRQLYILQGFPSIGPKRAERLLDRFGSVRNIINATVDELASVNGIGYHTADSISMAVKECLFRYGS